MSSAPTEGSRPGENHREGGCAPQATPRPPGLHEGGRQTLRVGDRQMQGRLCYLSP